MTEESTTRFAEPFSFATDTPVKPAAGHMSNGTHPTPAIWNCTISSTMFPAEQIKRET
jgi:hypothetical protein